MYMSKELSLSIVIPVYNEEHHLKDCLESIAIQTVKPDQVIVVDNNSTDATIKIARNYTFVTLLNEKKQGVMYARNKGFNAVTSDIIGRIDADTKLSNNWIARALHDFGQKDIAAVTGSGYWYDMPGIPGNQHAENLFKSYLYRNEKEFPFLFGSNMAIRRSVWRSIKGELCSDSSLHEDLDLAIHLYKNHFNILYDKKLRIGMSSRRYDDSPSDFIKYMQAYTMTYRRHNLPTSGPHIAVAAFSLGYVMLWPLRRSYNPKTKRYQIRHLLKGGNKPRRSPID